MYVARGQCRPASEDKLSLAIAPETQKPLSSIQGIQRFKLQYETDFPHTCLPARVNQMPTVFYLDHESITSEKMPSMGFSFLRTAGNEMEMKRVSRLREEEEPEFDASCSGGGMNVQVSCQAFGWATFLVGACSFWGGLAPCIPW
jgi:hypothetical protein